MAKEEKTEASSEQIVKYLNESLGTEITHGIEVSRLAGLLAKEMKQDREFCHDVEVAGVLHDVGKLRISTYLYGGEDKTLDVEKLRYIRMHSSLGYDIIKARGYSKRVCEMVLHHHENYDGTGYPDNLFGEKIPLGARILRVCDVFVAMTSDRPYRKAFESNVAVELLIEEIRHFDMRVFLAFQRVIHEELLQLSKNDAVQDKLVYYKEGIKTWQ